MLLTSHPELLHPKVLNPLRAAQKNPKIQEKNTQKIHPKIRGGKTHVPQRAPRARSSRSQAPEPITEPPPLRASNQAVTGRSSPLGLSFPVVLGPNESNLCLLFSSVGNYSKRGVAPRPQKADGRSRKLVYSSAGAASSCGGSSNCSGKKRKKSSFRGISWIFSSSGEVEASKDVGSSSAMWELPKICCVPPKSAPSRQGWDQHDALSQKGGKTPNFLGISQLGAPWDPQRGGGGREVPKNSPERSQIRVLGEFG